MNGRRKLVIALGAGVLAAPFVRAQQSVALHRIGILVGGSGSAAEAQAQLAALRDGLHRLGWIEGRNLEIESHWGGGNVSVMRTQAEALVSSKPEVIAVSTATALREVQRVAGRTPIVFWGVSDPVGNKFVNGLSRPGNNTTGFSLFEYEMGGKWLQLLKEAAPHIRQVLVLMNSANPNWPGWARAIESTAPSLGLEVTRPRLVETTQIEPEITAFARKANGGLLALPDPFLSPHRELITGLAAKHRLPSVYGLSTYTQGGGLISYGVDQLDLATRAATYVDRILKGASPADLPVERPTKFELVINRKTARVLGLTIPQSLLIRVDRLID